MPDHAPQSRVPDARRRLSTISAEEWIRTLWVEVTEHRDNERMFVSGGLRTPDEAAREKANGEAMGWEEYRAETRALAAGEQPIPWADARPDA